MIRRINLLPEDLRVVSKRRFYFIASLSILLFCSILYVVNNKQRFDIRAFQAERDLLQQRIAVLARQDAGYKETMNSINLTEAKKKDMEDKIRVVDAISSGRIQWANPLYDLSNIVPAGLWLSGMSTSDVVTGDKKFKEVKLNGMSFSSARIADFMAALESSPHFEGVALTYVQNVGYHGKEAFSFEMTFRIGGTK